MKKIQIELDEGDSTELFHIIQGRGFCVTRSKLLEALFQLAPDLAKRIDDDDAKEVEKLVYESSKWTD
jgi:hypothetical protein